MARRQGKTRGFEPTWALLGDRVRKAGESRGFAVSRVLTHWPETFYPNPHLEKGQYDG